ncbi:MAG: sigma-54-dependent Fis family transcriptional regulator, partial [Deltaproteobacteria bacterium]
DLLEAELFGYEPGAFTGAGRKAKPGKFELAHEGTIFLDEIGDMPLEMQAKLLRVLEEKEIERIGGIRPIRTDFRLITATHEDLGKLVEAGKFREDLYYRVNVIRIDIPPLRKRREDIPLLIEYFLKKMKRSGKDIPWQITDDAINFLTNEYHWPGNVRELVNVLERVTSMAEGNVIRLDEILPFTAEWKKEKYKITSDYFKKVTAEAEREALLKLLEQVGGNVRKAADIIGVHRTGLYKKLKKYGLRL